MSNKCIIYDENHVEVRVLQRERRQSRGCTGVAGRPAGRGGQEACGKGARTVGQRLYSGHQLSRPEWPQDSETEETKPAGRSRWPGDQGGPGLLQVVGLGRF